MVDVKAITEAKSAAVNSGKATVRIYFGQSGFAELMPEWQQLAAAKAAHFLHYPGWYGAELKNRRNDSQIYFVACYEDAKLFAILPLERTFWRKGRITVPVLQLFYPNEMGVNDIISDRPLAPYRATLVQTLRRTLPYFAFIRCQCVLENGYAVTLLAEDQKARPTHTSKHIDFSQGFNIFWENYRSKFRKSLQKKMRKAEEQGALRLWCATRSGELPEAFEHFLAVEDSGWKGDAGTSIKKQPDKLAYYQYLLDHYARHGLCQINILYCNDIPIAAQFGVRVGSRLFLLKIGYREDFAAVSPGYLLLYKLAEQSAAQGSIDSVSFVTGVNWIDRWHPRHISVGIFYLSNGSWYSAALVWALEKAVRLRDSRKKTVPDDDNSEDSDP